MDDDPEEPERFRAIDLVNERGNRLLPQEWKGGREVDEITGVRHNRRDTGLLDPLAEEPHLGRVERLPAPLARVLGEDLERLAAVHHRAIDGLRDTAGHGHVCADSKHSDHYNYRMRAALVVTALFVVAVPAPAHAWGFAAHKFIMDRAIALLPAALRPMFERDRATLVERSIE